MLKIRNPFYYDKKQSTIIVVSCYGCGKGYQIGRKELRVANYCGSCK
jgi:hypothetical protein